MFYDNYESICKKKGSNASAIAMKIGLARSTSASWKANGTIPKQDVLDKLAKELGCQVSDFFIEQHNSTVITNSVNCNNTSTRVSLNEEEEELLELYKSIKNRKDRLKFMLNAYEQVDNLRGDSDE